MRKIYLYLIIMVLVLNTASAFSFKFNIAGYDLSYNQAKEVQVIDKVNNKIQNKDIPMTQKRDYETITPKQDIPKQLNDFDKDITALNKIPEVKKALKDLGYTRIAFTDTDKHERYVFLIDNEGIIISVYKDSVMHADVELKGSLQKVKDYAHRGDFERLKLAVEIPFKVKLKLLLHNWYS